MVGDLALVVRINVAMKMMIRPKIKMLPLKKVDRKLNNRLFFFIKFFQIMRVSCIFSVMVQKKIKVGIFLRESFLGYGYRKQTTFF